MIFQVIDQPDLPPRFQTTSAVRPIAVGAAVEWAQAQGILTDANPQNNISALSALLGDWTATYAISMNIDQLDLVDSWVGVNRAGVALPRFLTNTTVIDTLLDTYDMLVWRAGSKGGLTTDTGMTDAMVAGISKAHGDTAAIHAQELLRIALPHPLSNCFAMKRFQFTTCSNWCWDVLRNLLECSTEEPELCGFSLCEPGNLAAMAQHLVATYALINELTILFVDESDYSAVTPTGYSDVGLDSDMPGPVLE